MFRDVPECSGMFRVPGFIDGRFKDGFQVTWNFFESFQLSDFNEMQSKVTWDFTEAFAHAFLVK